MSKSAFERALIALFALAIVACEPAGTCVRESDCTSGLACRAGQCVVVTDAGGDAEVDGGHDAGRDAGSDAGADAGIDGGNDADVDAGVDGGNDADVDADVDAGNDAA